MRFTVAMVAEKVLELLDVEPLCVCYGEPGGINGFSSYTRERHRPDVLWLNDNSSGQRPYASCGATHCIHIASRTEEAEGLPPCAPGRSLVALPHTVHMRRLVTAMERAFSFFNAWSDGLLDVLRREGDWYELVEEGHRVLRNPMMIYNRSMRLLACTAQDGTEDAIWSDTVRDGVARAESPKESENLMRFLTQVEEHDEPFRFSGESMSDPFWSAPVKVGDRRRGMVNVVEFHRPLSPGDRDLLRVFAEYVAIGMQRSDFGAQLPDAVPRQFMLDLLNGSIASRDSLNARLIAVDWRTLDCFCFVSLRSSLPFLSGEKWRNCYERLLALGLNGLCCMLDEPENHIALLLTGDGPDKFSMQLEVVGQFCTMSKLRAGVSDVYDDLLQTPRFCRQAETALELQEGALCRYETARYRRMLRHLRNHSYLEDLMHPAVARLAALDREEGSEYIPTLRALVEHSFNQLETAEALGIHRTTLAYRLRRIQELTGLRPSGGGEMFHVAVSLKLMEEE